jgi:hypothetical protein
MTANKFSIFLFALCLGAAMFLTAAPATERQPLVAVLSTNSRVPAMTPQVYRASEDALRQILLERNLRVRLGDDAPKLLLEFGAQSLSDLSVESAQTIMERLGADMLVQLTVDVYKVNPGRQSPRSVKHNPPRNLHGGATQPAPIYVAEVGGTLQIWKKGGHTLRLVPFQRILTNRVGPLKDFEAPQDARNAMTQFGCAALRTALADALATPRELF